MGVFDIFGSKHGFDPNKFEKEFSQLTGNINKTKQQLARLTQRKRKLNAKLEAFVSIGYILIFSYCYFSIPNDVRATNRVQQFIKGQTKQNLYVLIGYPLISIVVIKFINYAFNYLIRRHDRFLAKLQAKHKAKMDELKKITNFNATNELINKYGEKQLPQQIPLAQKSSANKKSTKQDNLRAQALKELHLSDKQLSQNENSGTATTQDNSGKSQQPKAATATPRTFQDRLLDLFVGSDNSESVEQRYALICSHCFAHNGLAPPHCEDPSLVKYQCWKCGALNGKGMLFGNSGPDEQHLEDSASTFDKNIVPSDVAGEGHIESGPINVTDDIKANALTEKADTPSNASSEAKIDSDTKKESQVSN
ncbi:hypothetical protein FOB58_003100 [Candida parapsilosis]|uniref:Endoplasmic reticulum junction formation protein lunapark n=2 Tax=Candida parapsilosis TaxID=5480 RepID=G8B702_CANPC|nr:uncharacterized protein CPAR2_102720 [Candida parapsilosis]KAF6048211.1 hypothetical protein FOB59_003253 [Candida parapsilosis]KAF6049823.1 hypothetical protein FOB58_003100 [Candida parapsilosis]KAF6057686.1 hypothetical protein FOB60_002241 [Candida parapsilosis]KAF6065607.1 hypothetical protein FOB61_001677 [Candida parapsilosis]KAI5909206.1 Endoplasmic reticulum junction formation protein lunapark [Candida parapsilosis]